MGEVYRATDTRLGRDVAIKVLPPEVGQDPERLARFNREAHLLAALNHPNIAAIYGLEEADGKPFLVLELVEGEDLKERLARGPVPVDETLEIATQIAEAVEEAHSKGIIHRDLKPANVKLTPDGKVKVLDFGLAKAWSGAGPGGPSATGLSQAPTLADTRTAAGAILGTAAYMSPEQARGKPVDKRADVWSFGVLLGEMLTGRSLFSGDTVADKIAAVVTKEPDLDALPVSTPLAVRRLLGRCLRKDPRTRLPDIGAARLDLQDLLAGTGAEAEAPTAVGREAQAARRRLTRERWAWSAVVLALAGVVAFRVLPRPTEAPEVRPTARFVFDMPEDVTLADFDPLAVSPDGRSIVFVGRSPTGTTQLWTRPLDVPQVRALPGTRGAGQPFWSPDGASIAFFAEGELRKLSLASGAVQRICALPQGDLRAGTWNNEGTIVFSTGDASVGLYSVPAAGGETTPLTTPKEETSHWWPHFLPDGRRFLFEIFGSQSAGVHVASLDAPDETHRLLPVSMRARYGSGHLLFVQDGSTLQAQPFDVARAGLTGEPVAVASSVASSGKVPRWGWFSVSPGGLLAYVEGEPGGSELAWFDRKGARLGTVGEPGVYSQITLSPDERHVAVQLTIPGEESDIWTIDLVRGVATRVTLDPGQEANPVWSPDGRELIFSSAREGSFRLYRKALRGNEPASPLGETPNNVYPQGWSADGKMLVYLHAFQDTRAFWALPWDVDLEPELILKKDFLIDEPQVSPDGRWLAYVSQESGEWEVYVEPFRRVAERVRVSPAGGGQPKWRGDGQELFYVSPDGRLMAVEVRTGEVGLEVSLPTALFEAGVADPVLDEYAVTADGERFLVISAAEDDTGRRIHVVLNWPSLLE